MNQTGVSQSGMPQGGDMLRMLGATGAASLIRPGASAGSQSSEGLDFMKLLENAKAGKVSSGLPVKASKNSGLNLSAEQLQRLGTAADLAEAAGASRVLVMMDGMALRLDVGVREVTGAATMQPGQVLTGIDAIVQMPPGADGSGSGDTGHATGIAPTLVPLAGSAAGAPLSESLLKALERPMIRKSA